MGMAKSSGIEKALFHTIVSIIFKRAVFTTLKKQEVKQMKKQILTLLIILLVVSICYSPVKLMAAPFYKGKTIRLVVGSAPGGGYDRWARLIARHMPKYIPGKPNIIIQNIPGATSIVAANYLYNIAKPDGLTFGAVQRGLPFAQLLQKKGVKFDLRKFSWIG